ncbi:MAG: MATE family efflux transporter [Pseudomonadales bacterium]|nr:MATE family efflux transporter [Pseudomonadales bacterium]
MTEITTQKVSGAFAEIGHLFRLALPLMGAQLAQMGMGVADAIMAGQYDSVDLAGVALGGSVMWPTMMLMMGLIQAVTPTVAQLRGSGEFGEIGEVIRQGLWMALCGGLLASFILNHIGIAYTWMDVDPRASAVSIPYLRMCSFGIPALMCFFCLRFLADGMGFTRPALLIAICALLLKIPLNYVLIYGMFGLPEMGGVGCGVAQAIIMWFQLLLIILIVTRRRFDVTGWRSRISMPDYKRIGALLILGVPIGLSIFAEMGLFAFTTLLLGRFGAEVVASHNIAMNINGLLFMTPMALGMASTIRIGHRIGAGDIAEARTTAAIALLATLVIALLSSIFIFFFREVLVSFYTTDPEVMHLSVTLLLFVVFFLMFDATQTTAMGALRGYKDTRVPMYIALFSYWLIGLPLGATLGFGWITRPMEVYGFWIGLAAGVGTAAGLLTWRLVWLSAHYRALNRAATT